MMTKEPKIAIVENNTLAAMGLKQLLKTTLPMVHIEVYSTFGEFESSHPEEFFHYFVSMHIVLAHRYYFLDEKRQHHTIVLTASNDPNSQLDNFHCLCTNVSEKMLFQELLSLQKQGHPHGEHLPKLMARMNTEKVLSDRETEVLALIAQGKINKEIADKLCIGLTTVITHRKNLQEKLGLKSVSALTIYAVTHGLVDINHI